MGSLSLATTKSSLLFCYSASLSPNFRSPTIFKWALQRNRNSSPVMRRSNGQAVRVLANPNASPSKKNSNDGVTMVDPLEAKRLAAIQMQEIKAKEKFMRRRRIEAINGAWAMIGLMVGLVVEGQTGKGILSQLAGYWEAIIGFFVR